MAGSAEGVRLVRYRRPSGPGLVLDMKPRLASWDRAGSSGQLRLGEYLSHVRDLLHDHLATMAGPWTLGLHVGLPGADILAAYDLDNYAYPLVHLLAPLAPAPLVCVWCWKDQSETSRLWAQPAELEVLDRGEFYQLQTIASSQSVAYKSEIRQQVANWLRLPPALSPLRFSLGWVPAVTGRTSGSRLSMLLTRYSVFLTLDSFGTRRTVASSSSVCTGPIWRRAVTAFCSASLHNQWDRVVCSARRVPVAAIRSYVERLAEQEVL